MPSGWIPITVCEDDCVQCAFSTCPSMRWAVGLNRQFAPRKKLLRSPHRKFRHLRFDSSGALVLRTRNETNPELRNFHKRLGLALAERAGLKGVRFNLTPHVTMLYASNGVTEDLGEPVGWTVSECVLVCSHQGQTHYEVIARHSLLP